tara:strand:- start:64 stop:825 length:762 start_codon:yes stop_codon:yes gene_type:complete
VPREEEIEAAMPDLEKMNTEERGRFYIRTYLNIHGESSYTELSTYSCKEAKFPISIASHDRYLKMMIKSGEVRKIDGKTRQEGKYATRTWLEQEEYLQEDLNTRVLVISKLFDIIELMMKNRIGISLILFDSLDYIRSFQNMVHVLSLYANTERSRTLKKMEDKEIPKLLKRFDKLAILTEPTGKPGEFVMAEMSSFVAVRNLKSEMQVRSRMRDSILDQLKKKRISEKQAAGILRSIDDMENIPLRVRGYKK